MRLNELPKKLRQDTVTEMKKNLEKEQAKKDGETEAAYAGRLFGMRAVEEFATSVILDAADVTLGLKLDAKTDKLLIDLSMTAAPGSTLAKQTKQLGNLRSKFAALAADSAFNLLCQLPVSEDIRKSFSKVVEMGFREALDKEADAAKKKLAERAFNAVRDCFATARFGVFLPGRTTISSSASSPATTSRTARCWRAARSSPRTARTATSSLMSRRWRRRHPPHHAPGKVDKTLTMPAARGSFCFRDDAA